MSSSVLHLVPCMINVALAMHASPSFFFSFSQMLSYVFYYTVCFSTSSFSFAPENLVSRDGFGSLVPRQLFFTLLFSQILSCSFYHNAYISTLFSCAPENLVSRDGFGSPVPRQSAHLLLNGIWCLLTGFLPNPAATSIYLFNSLYAIGSLPSLSGHATAY